MGGSEVDQFAYSCIHLYIATLCKQSIKYQFEYYIHIIYACIVVATKEISIVGKITTYTYICDVYIGNYYVGRYACMHVCCRSKQKWLAKSISIDLLTFSIGPVCNSASSVANYYYQVTVFCLMLLSILIVPSEQLMYWFTVECLQ